jgi:hypothetical protein
MDTVEWSLINWCKNVCGESHKCDSKEYMPQRVSQEEADWLHCSSKYLTDDLHISIKKPSQPLEFINNKKTTHS